MASLNVQTAARDAGVEVINDRGASGEDFVGASRGDAALGG
jgi:hypothetical protein